MKNKAIHLLRKSEKYTKTDMVYLIGKSGWLILGQGIIFLSSMMLVWVFANYVSPSDYGLYKYVLSIATIASITSLTGFSVPIAKAAAQGFNISLNKLATIQIRYGLIGSLGLFTMAGYYLVKDNTLLASLFAVAAIWIPFTEPLSIYQYLLQGKKNFKTQIFLRIIQRFVLTVGLVTVILLTKNIVIITLSYFTLLTVSQFLVYLYTVKKYPVTDDTDTPYSNIVSYGKSVSIQNIFFVGAGQLDKILMFKFIGPAQLAIYYFAAAIPNEIQGMLGNINSVAFPKLVNQTSPAFKVALLKKIALFTGILIVPAISYILIAPFIFNWLFPVYTDAIYLTQLYIGTILFIPGSLLWQYFYATEDKQALWFGTFVGPSIFILGIIIFVPLYGLLGAIIATYVRSTTDLISGLYFFLRTKNKTSTEV